MLTEQERSTKIKEISDRLDESVLKAPIDTYEDYLSDYFRVCYGWSTETEMKNELSKYQNLALDSLANVKHPRTKSPTSDDVLKIQGIQIGDRIRTTKSFCRGSGIYGTVLWTEISDISGGIQILVIFDELFQGHNNAPKGSGIELTGRNSYYLFVGEFVRITPTVSAEPMTETSSSSVIVDYFSTDKTKGHAAIIQSTDPSVRRGQKLPGVKVQSARSVAAICSGQNRNRKAVMAS